MHNDDIIPRASVNALLRLIKRIRHLTLDQQQVMQAQAWAQLEDAFNQLEVCRCAPAAQVFKPLLFAVECEQAWISVLREAVQVVARESVPNACTGLVAQLKDTCN